MHDLDLSLNLGTLRPANRNLKIRAANYVAAVAAMRRPGVHWECSAQLTIVALLLEPGRPFSTKNCVVALQTLDHIHQQASSKSFPTAKAPKLMFGEAESGEQA